MARPRRFYIQPDNANIPDWHDPNYEHDSSEFVISSIDEEGGSDRCQFRAPEQLVSWAERIVHSGKFPFGSKGDLYRWGLFLACCTLSHIEKGGPSFEAQLRMQNKVVRWREQAAQFMAHLEPLAQLLETYRKEEAWGEIRATLAEEYRQAEIAAGYERYWGPKYRAELDKRFGYLLATAMSKIELIDLRPSRAFAPNGQESER